MRVLVTGSRRAGDHKRGVIYAALAELAIACAQNEEPLTIIHGGARGVDAMAHAAAEVLGVNVWSFPAEWDHYRSLGNHKGAGMARNMEMLDYKPDLVLAFPDNQSKGTLGMVEMAKANGIRTEVRWL